MMVGSEVQEIRGWGKQSGELPPGEISGSCRGSRPGSQCTALGLPGHAGRGQVPTGHRSSMVLAASTLLSWAAPEHSPGREAGGHHRGTCWEQWRLPGQGWWEVGEGEGHCWGSWQAGAGNAALPKLPTPALPRTTVLCPCPSQRGRCPCCCRGSLHERRAPQPQWLSQAK